MDYNVIGLVVGDFSPNLRGVYMDDVVKSGKVKWFDETKGFGFIIPDDNPDLDVFVHYSVVPGTDGKRNLLTGDHVTFIQGEREDGVYAKKVITVVRS